MEDVPTAFSHCLGLLLQQQYNYSFQIVEISDYLLRSVLVGALNQDTEPSSTFLVSGCKVPAEGLKNIVISLGITWFYQ